MRREVRLLVLGVATRGLGVIGILVNRLDVFFRWQRRFLPVIRFKRSAVRVLTRWRHPCLVVVTRLDSASSCEDAQGLELLLLRCNLLPWLLMLMNTHLVRDGSHWFRPLELASADVARIVRQVVHGVDERRPGLVASVQEAIVALVKRGPA